MSDTEQPTELPEAGASTEIRQASTPPTVQAAKWAVLGSILGGLIVAMGNLGAARIKASATPEDVKGASVEDNPDSLPPAPSAVSSGATEKVIRKHVARNADTHRVVFGDGTESLVIQKTGRYFISLHLTMDYSSALTEQDRFPYFNCGVRRYGSDGNSKTLFSDHTFGVSCGGTFSAKLESGDQLSTFVGQASGRDRMVDGSLHVAEIDR